ncbi:hypothetical protein K505DRAFT_87483 [Melanomma pulvis-pyrius CBS 109.77]|uniref:GmrSD restriction endonucleases N-terminal domain-containing protein n=1 Tax=Melanomma pulvis-pyrius CBS 109.77 TaxID=1314802 RepID=A0A6A6XQT2_9PLEO|nr:hypothetical protein K505DRAFT_87483 [Melanomma pulvis-pyrius CBS 109.77]
MPGWAMKPDLETQPILKHETEETVNDFESDLAEDDDGMSFRPRSPLSSSTVIMRSIKWLIKHMEHGHIDLEPDYQREVVWTGDRMTGLINSLMENFYIPPIILSKHSTEDNKHILVCVDGKQRLSSVRAFVQGIIPCSDYRGERWWFRDISTGGKRKVLSEGIQNEFLKKDFVSFQFTDLSPQQEEDVFSRVQMGVQLTAAERIRASTGPWQELSRMFVEDFSVVLSLLKDRTRAKDFQLVLSCFSQILEVQHPSAPNGVPILRTNYPVLPKLLKHRDALDYGVKSHLASVFTTFRELVEEDPDVFTNADKRLKGVQTFAPVEMVAVSVLISQYSDSRNNKLLLGDIQALRESLRENFTDLRMNHPLWKHCWEYIDDLEKIRGAVDGTTYNREVEPNARGPPPVVKRGQPTARTEPVSVAPRSETTVTPLYKPAAVASSSSAAAAATVKPEEPPPPTPPTETNSRKRQRVDPEPGNSTHPSSRPRLEANGHQNTRSSTADPLVLEDTAAPAPTLGPKRPTPPTAVTASRPKIQMARRSRPPPGAGALPVIRSSRPGTLTPEQARQSRIAVLNGFRAPGAPVAPPPAPAAHTAVQTPAQSCPVSLSRHKKPASFPAQIDGVIDLTDDMEVEHQSLLTRFHASKTPKAPANKQNDVGSSATA